MPPMMEKPIETPAATARKGLRIEAGSANALLKVITNRVSVDVN